MSTMTAEIQAKLRQPFAPNEVGKKPKLKCRACSNADGKVCANHRKATCRICGNWISDAHIHLDYVGHAEVTDRLLQVDPEWNWEPLAFAPNGLPQLDESGGLWIRCTVAGVPRIGYGHADGKRGADAIKEAIGDAIRNAVMRQGVGLDLWGAKFEAATDAGHTDEPEQPEPARTGQDQAAPRYAVLSEAIADSKDLDTLKRWWDQVAYALEAGDITKPESTQLADAIRARKAAIEAPAMVTELQHRRMHAIWRKLGMGGDENRDRRLERIRGITGRHNLTSSKELTEQQAQLVIEAIDAEVKEQRTAVAR